MGLIHNLVISVVHLLFVTMDILATMVLIKVVYQRWRPSWFKQTTNIVEPVMKLITGHLGTYFTRFTNRTYTDKTLTLILIVCLTDSEFRLLKAVINNPMLSSSSDVKLAWICPNTLKKLRPILREKGFIAEHVMDSGNRGRSKRVWEPLDAAN